MHVVVVNVRVKTGSIDAFRAATLENARQSVLEPGIARFDFLQALEDPTRFVLIEGYRTPEDAVKHKETAHYQKWSAAVAPLLAEERIRIKLAPLFTSASTATPEGHGL